MTEIPKAAIEAAAEIVKKYTPEYGDDLDSLAKDVAINALQATAPHWYDPNEFAYGAGFRDGIGAAAELVRKRLGHWDNYPSDPELGEEVATDILALTPQAKP